MPVVTCIEDLRVLAQRRVPRMVYEYVDSGSWTEGTYRANSDDFRRIKLRQRVAVNVADRSTRAAMAGQDVAMPVALAPTGLTGMQHADGEILAARAAAMFGVPFTLSTMSVCSLEDVTAHCSAPLWFQLYVMKDRSFVERLIERARRVNCSALVVTMDLRAVFAADSAADALVVSNHGGRQLDGAPSSISALPEVVDAVGKRIEVHMDGGIRSGQDVLKALALGAKGGRVQAGLLPTCSCAACVKDSRSVGNRGAAGIRGERECARHCRRRRFLDRDFNRLAFVEVLAVLQTRDDAVGPTTRALQYHHGPRLGIGNRQFIQRAAAPADHDQRVASTRRQ